MTSVVLEVVETGPLATVQDLGRPGLAALGVGRSGAADLPAHRLANRLVGNDDTAATVEVTYGGLVVRASAGTWVALAGAPCPVTVDGRPLAPYAPLWLPAGATLRLGVPQSGLRSYLAVRGGLDVPPVLESRSTDTLAGVGPEPLAADDRLPVGTAPVTRLCVDQAPTRLPVTDEVRLRVVPGPRADWFTEAARAALLAETWEVTSESDRVGMRLAGPALERTRDDELPSEGMVAGALQVPPSGQPTLFLADHPVTGGYPVVACVVAADVCRAAQARPGQRLRLVAAPTHGGEHDG